MARHFLTEKKTKKKTKKKRRRNLVVEIRSIDSRDSVEVVGRTALSVWKEFSRTWRAVFFKCRWRYNSKEKQKRC